MDNSSSRGPMPDRLPWKTQQRHIAHELKGRLKKRLRQRRGLSFEDAMALVLDEIRRSLALGIVALMVEEGVL